MGLGLRLGVSAGVEAGLVGQEAVAAPLVPPGVGAAAAEALFCWTTTASQAASSAEPVAAVAR